MNIEMINDQYKEYCKRMKEKDGEFAIISFNEFKKALERTEEKKNV